MSAPTPYGPTQILAEATAAAKSAVSKASAAAASAVTASSSATAAASSAASARGSAATAATKAQAATQQAANAEASADAAAQSALAIAGAQETTAADVDACEAAQAAAETAQGLTESARDVSIGKAEEAASSEGNALSYKDAALAAAVAADLSAQAAAASASQAASVAALTNVSFASPDARPTFVLRPEWAVTDPKLACTRTTAAWRIKRNQVYESVAANIARLDWDMGRPGWLCEGPRTNYLLQSDDLTSTSWSKVRSSLGGTIPGPWGTTLTKVIENTDLNSHLVQQTGTMPANTVVTYSRVVAAGERSLIRVSLRDGTATNGLSVEFNLLTKVATLKNIYGAGVHTASRVVDIGGGLLVLEMTGLIDTTSTTYLLGEYMQVVSGAATYQGDGVSGAYFGHAQLEPGYCRTSPIITTTAQVTTTYEYLTVLPGNIPGWSTSKGTVVQDFIWPTTQAASVPIFDVGTNTSTENVRFYLSTSGGCVSKVFIASVGTTLFDLTASALAAVGIVPGAHVRAGLTWNNNTWKAAIAGPAGVILGAAATSSAFPNTDKLRLCSFTNSAGQLMNNKLYGFAFYPASFSDNELKALVEV